MEKLGDRLRVLHIQDNFGVLDNHVVPGRGVIDWPAFMKVFRESGYQGTFNFEVDGYLDDFNREWFGPDVITQSLKALYLIGKTMLNMK